MSDRTFKAIGFAVAINFAIFWLIAVTYGGDALNGKIVDNRYYIGAHGLYHKVSRAFCVYSALHAGASMVGIWTVVISFRRRERNPS